MGLAHSPSIITSGLVLALDAGNPKSYPGSGTTWTDLSGNSNNAVGIGTSMPTYSSANGGSFVFNGTSSYVSVPYTPVLAPTNQISYGAWAFLSNWNIENDIRILSKTQIGGYQIAINQPHIGIGNFGGIIYLGGEYREAKVARSTISPGWHYIMMTCDGRYFRLYIDAVNVNTYDHGSISIISYSTNNYFVVGAEPTIGADIAGRYWTGSIAQVSVYNRALTPQEIQQNFNALRGRFGI